MTTASPPYDPARRGDLLDYLTPHMREYDAVEVDPAENEAVYRFVEGGVVVIGRGQRLRVDGHRWQVLAAHTHGVHVVANVVRRPDRLATPDRNGETLYVAGPMTGYPDLNYPAFHAAAAALRDAGYAVLNPADTDALPSWEDYMTAGLRQVLDAHGIALLPGWQESRGAALEVHVAHALRLPTLPVDVWAARE